MSLAIPSSAGGAVARTRLGGIDVVRGAVMLLMAIDHVRVYSGLPAGGPTPGIFFTRWVTHFCAPACVFLAGSSAFLYLAAQLTRHAFSSRAASWPVVLELTYFRVMWTFNFEFSRTAGRCDLGDRAVHDPDGGNLAAAGQGHRDRGGGLAIIAGHNLLDRYVDQLTPTRQTAWGSDLWRILLCRLLRRTCALGAHGPNLMVWDLIVPWIGVMAAGYAFGAILVLPPERRDRLCAWIGAGAAIGFVLLRLVNHYGDPNPWSPPATGPRGPQLPSLLSFLAATKYPASLDYLLMTLGPAIALLPMAQRASGRLARFLSVFGRVPFFYYALHIPLIHVLALVVSKVRLGEVSWWLFTNHPMGNPPPPDGYTWSLPLLYAVWAIAIALLYPACQWMAGLKARHADAWLNTSEE